MGKSFLFLCRSVLDIVVALCCFDFGLIKVSNVKETLGCLEVTMGSFLICQNIARPVNDDLWESTIDPINLSYVRTLSEGGLTLSKLIKDDFISFYPNDEHQKLIFLSPCIDNIDIIELGCFESAFTFRLKTNPKELLKTLTILTKCKKTDFMSYYFKYPLS